MEIVVQITVRNLDDDGYCVGSPGRDDVKVPPAIFEKLAEEVEPGSRRSKKKDRDRVAQGLGALMRAWIDVCQVSQGLRESTQWHSLPLVSTFVKRFPRGPKSD